MKYLTTLTDDEIFLLFKEASELTDAKLVDIVRNPDEIELQLKYNLPYVDESGNWEDEIRYKSYTLTDFHIFTASGTEMFEDYYIRAMFLQFGNQYAGDYLRHKFVFQWY